MNDIKKNMVYLQCCSKQTADMLRKQPCLVRTENLDNSLYTRTKTEVVHPTVVQNLQNRMKLVRTFFVP